MRYLFLLIVLLGLLVAPTAANAAAYPQGASLDNEWVTRSSLEIAYAYWQRRPTCRVSVTVSETKPDPALPEGWAAATTPCPDGRVSVRWSQWVNARGKLRSRVWYCAAIVHEVGHVLGYPHAQRGIMALDGGGYVPDGCRFFQIKKRASQQT